MKGHRALVLAAILVSAASACRSYGPLDVQISVPGVTPFPAGTLSNILVAGFRDEAPLPDFAPGPALEEALVNALRRELRETAGLVDRVPVDAVPGRDDPAAWKAAGEGRPVGTVFLAGSVKLSGATLKAIDPKAMADGPFNLVRRLLAKRRWTLTSEISVISAATGETLHRATYRESQDYGELDKPPEFAFSELSDRLVVQLGQALLGRATLETRTLLRR